MFRVWFYSGDLGGLGRVMKGGYMSSMSMAAFLKSRGLPQLVQVENFFLHCMKGLSSPKKRRESQILQKTLINVLLGSSEVWG